MHFILRGITGSQAHGLATASSDVDQLGTFAHPTSAFWSLDRPEMSRVTHNPDATFHEIEKFLALAIKANPSVTELLWLDDYLEIEPQWGEALLAIRTAFPSKRYVLNAYMGYAESQFRKLMQRGDGTFSANTSNRSPKHARHMFRLIEQGKALWQTGVLPVRVAEPAEYQRFNEMTMDELADEFTRRWEDFTGATSVLPDEPDVDAVNAYLRAYRAAHLE